MTRINEVDNSGPVVYIIEASLAVPCDSSKLDSLRREAALAGRPASLIRFAEIACADGGHTTRLLCEVEATSLTAANDAVTAEVSQLMRRATPDLEVGVQTRAIGVKDSPPAPALSTEDRWGWYRVSLVLRGPSIVLDPSLGPTIQREIPKLRRFRDAVVIYEPGSNAVSVRVLTVGRSQEAAYREAADGIGAVLTAVEGSRSDYSVEIKEASWIADAGPESDAAPRPA